MHHFMAVIYVGFALIFFKSYFYCHSSQNGLSPTSSLAFERLLGSLSLTPSLRSIITLLEVCLSSVVVAQV